MGKRYLILRNLVNIAFNRYIVTQNMAQHSKFGSAAGAHQMTKVDEGKDNKDPGREEVASHDESVDEGKSILAVKLNVTDWNSTNRNSCSG